MSLNISSFGWGVAKALKGDLRVLADWPDVHPLLMEGFRNEFYDANREKVLTIPVLQEIYYWTIKFCGLENGFVSRPAQEGDLIAPPSAVVGHKMPEAKVITDASGNQIKQPVDPDEPSPLITNSFYLNNLCQAMYGLKDDDLSPLLMRYLGAKKTADRPDVLKDLSALDALLDKNQLPLGKWPSQGSSPLVTLQQAVVNHTIGGDLDIADEKPHPTEDGGHLVGVNGPPGTGKTTLLKDVVAGLIVKRASIMASFDNPRSAFSTSRRNGVYDVSEKLCGFEIMICSANNAAVENISKEWPAAGAIDARSGLSHLPKIAAMLYGEEQPVWGAISAVLGNSGNRFSFLRKFWYNADYGLRNHLKYINGERRTVPIENTKPTQYREPRAALEHKLPANRYDALERWKHIRKEFLALSSQVQSIVADAAEQKTSLDGTHEEVHSSSPRISLDADKLREQLFVKAMEVHRAFVDAAPIEMMANLQAFVDAMGERGSPRAGVGFTALSFVVPVWSTTFASVDRMTNQLRKGDIGWLIVDEAGQATPQMGVGAMAIARNAIAVGDPIQVEPVVTLNNNIAMEISRQFDLDYEKTMAPKASVQTYADAASEFCAEFDGDSIRTVGIPLLVHRRCTEPMFSISNAIGYGNLMVNARPAKPSIIRDWCGGSRWIDVHSASTDKFNGEEWDALSDLLSRVAQSGAPMDMYIITPFREIEHQIRRGINMTYQQIGLTSEQKDVLAKRVATIHKVQGRESDLVIFVLGAQGQKNARARQWAGDTPNILNVAVTRAKENIYVIGNRAEWSNCGYFGTLDRLIDDHPYAHIQPGQPKSPVNEIHKPVQNGMMDLLGPAA